MLTKSTKTIDIAIVEFPAKPIENGTKIMSWIKTYNFFKYVGFFVSVIFLKSQSSDVYSFVDLHVLRVTYFSNNRVYALNLQVITKFRLRVEVQNLDFPTNAISRPHSTCCIFLNESSTLFYSTSKVWNCNTLTFLEKQFFSSQYDQFNWIR